MKLFQEPIGVALGMATMGGVAPSYTEIIEAMSPIVYFPLDETSGSVVVNYGTLSSANGTYSGPTLAQIDAPGGGKAPSFDGSNDYVNIYSAALAGAFDGQVGSISWWDKVTNDDVWTDRSTDIAFTLATDASNYISYQKRSSNQNYARVYYDAAGDLVNINTLLAGTGWYHKVITWDDVANEVKLYINGEQWGDTQLASTWTGSLASNSCVIGEYAPPSGLPWNGSISHFAIWDRVLTATELGNLYSYASSIVSHPSPTSDAAVLFTFDDGVEDLYTTVYPIFVTAGEKFTAYLITSVLDAAGRITTAQAQTMYGAGMDMAIHCHTHTAYTSLTQAQIETDLSTAKGVLDAASMTRASSHVAYPFGGYDADVEAAMTAQSMLTGRGVANGYASFDQVHDHITLTQLPEWGIDASVSLDLLKDVVDEVTRYNKKIIFLLHSIEGDEITKLTDLITYVQSKNLPILTISEWYAQYKIVYP